MNRINLICLGVKDMKRSIHFYKNIGFKTYEKDENPSVVFFDSRGTKLELYSLEELAKDINEENPPEICDGRFGGITLAYNAKSKQEVVETIRLAAENGAVIVKQPQIVFWGGYSGYFKDINGYYWEVAYSDNWKFDDNDMLIIE